MDRVSEGRSLGSMFIMYVATLLFFAVGAVTTPQLGWYGMLAVPSWTPPELLIAAIWCVLFILTPISLSLFWEAASEDLVSVAFLYAGNGALVLLWNYLFFGLHMLPAALAAAALVGISVIAIILKVKRVSRKAAWLMVPYLLWTVFAAYLIYAIMTMN